MIEVAHYQVNVEQKMSFVRASCEKHHMCVSVCNNKIETDDLIDFIMTDPTMNFYFFLPT